MEIIPVIDLLDEQVVHARRGERQNYRAIQSSLCDSSAPLDIVHSLLELYPFRQIYIADLNGIQKRGTHYAAIQAIARQYPQLQIWLDSGIAEADHIKSWREVSLHHVLGSESMADLHHYEQIMQISEHVSPRPNPTILSLDFMAAGYQGPAQLLSDPDLWPDRVIGMTLTQVGSNEGPASKVLAGLISRAEGRKIYAAGGIRDMNDLLKLKDMGISGALVATALHNGKLAHKDIAKLSAA